VSSFIGAAAAGLAEVDGLSESDPARKGACGFANGDVDSGAGVTKIALDAGFSHLGRFAQVYRRIAVRDRKDQGAGI
jgi:hypothetical protein